MNCSETVHISVHMRSAPFSLFVTTWSLHSAVYRGPQYTYMSIPQLPGLLHMYGSAVHISNYLSL